MNKFKSTKQTNNSQIKVNGLTLKAVLCFWCFIFAIIYSTSSSATQGDSEANTLLAQSTSVGIAKNVEANLSHADKAKLLTNASPTKVSKGLTRKLFLEKKQQQYQEKLEQSRLKGTIASAKAVHHDFLIYDGYSQLLDDLDQDGFYHTFSIIFDADVFTYVGLNQAHVYAEIYLSEAGGPWFHFYTTDNFAIVGESVDDEFEVMSSLDNGYFPEHYDVLIELYEVGYSGIVASLSADEANGLYALPLESYDHEVDEYYEEHSHGGSLSLINIAFIFSLLIIRLWVRSNRCINK